MWHSVTAVEHGYNPIVFEGQQPAILTLLNVGPGTVALLAWDAREAMGATPDVKVEVRPGSQRILRAALVRVALQSGNEFAAVVAQVLSSVEPAVRMP